MPKMFSFDKYGGEEPSNNRKRKPQAHPVVSPYVAAGADKAKDAYQPEASEGIICRKGCGMTITGSLSDIMAHNAQHHPGE